VARQFRRDNSWHIGNFFWTFQNSISPTYPHAHCHIGTPNCVPWRTPFVMPVSVCFKGRLRLTVTSCQLLKWHDLARQFRRIAGTKFTPVWGLFEARLRLCWLSTISQLFCKQKTTVVYRGISGILTNFIKWMNFTFHGININIYRATRMHSADYAVARWLSVRPSVRLSHAGILSKRLNISSKFFSPSGSQTILFFSVPNGMAIFRWGPPPPVTGAPNARGYEKITIFDQYLALSRKWCKIGP